jgi:hypothetical protein
MDQRHINLGAGLLVPSFGTILVNSLSQLIEKGAGAPIPPSVFDVSFGCAFIIPGLAVTQKEGLKGALYFVFFFVLLVVLMLLNLVLAQYLPTYKGTITLVSDVLSLLVVAASIWKA